MAINVVLELVVGAVIVVAVVNAVRGTAGGQRQVVGVIASRKDATAQRNTSADSDLPASLCALRLCVTWNRLDQIMPQRDADIRQSPFLFFVRFTVNQFLLTVLVIAVFVVPEIEAAYTATSYDEQIIAFPWLIALVYTLLQGLLTGAVFLSWYFPIYRIQNGAVRWQRGPTFAEQKLVELTADAQIGVQPGLAGPPTGLWHDHRDRRRVAQQRAPASQAEEPAPSPRPGGRTERHCRRSRAGVPRLCSMPR